jgi:hypothetical protein
LLFFSTFPALRQDPRVLSPLSKVTGYAFRHAVIISSQKQTQRRLSPKIREAPPPHPLGNTFSLAEKHRRPVQQRCASSPMLLDGGSPLPPGLEPTKHLPGVHGRVSIDCLHGSIHHHQLAEIKIRSCPPLRSGPPSVHTRR